MSFFVGSIRSTIMISSIMISQKLNGNIAMSMGKPVSKDEKNHIFIVAVPMEGRNPEDIAGDAVAKIDAIFDKLIEEKNNKPDEEK